jgi:predicted nucleic acid-binding protein
MGQEVMKVLLDSVILIDHFNGMSAATRYIEKHTNDIAISVITRAEVLVGFDEESVIIAKELLDYFPSIPVTKDDADLAAELRRTYRWKLPDALQAAIAKNHKLRLVTRNTRDFDGKKHKFIVIPYTLVHI